MLDAPRQDWDLYDALTRTSDDAWIRNLTPQSRFAIYEDLFNLVWHAHAGRSGQSRLEGARWEAKLALRQRMAEAFAMLDNCRRGRPSKPNAD